MCGPCDHADDLDHPWPICRVHGCDNEVNPRRFYHIQPTCMELHPNTNRTFHIIDMPKTTPLVTNDIRLAKGIGASHKSNRQAF